MNYRDLYAFHNKEKYSVRAQLRGWTLYRPEDEFDRQELDSTRWRITKSNRSYFLSQLPSEFIIPATFPEGEYDCNKPSLVFLICMLLVQAVSPN